MIVYYCFSLFTAGPCHGGQYPRLGDTKNPGFPKPGLGTQKTRASLSPGRSSFLKFPAKADLIPRSGQLEVPHIGYIYSEIPVIYASPSPNLPE